MQAQTGAVRGGTCAQVPADAGGERRGDTHGDADAVDAKIAETEDAGAVGHDADLRVRVGPVAQHGADGLALLDRDEQGLGPRVERGVLETDVANCGGVDERHELTDIIDQEAVEQVDVLVLQGRKVQILVDIGLTRIDHPHRPRALSLQTLHGVWY